ncbi:MAG: hypothetical protein GHCLOJNM_04423 [bacterium]|nr:hypothetical protein [bacterium]
MRFRRAALALPVALLPCLLLLSYPAEGEPQPSDTLKDPVATILRSLEALRADPANLRSASEWLQSERKRAEMDLQVLETELSRLQSELNGLEGGNTARRERTAAAANGVAIPVMDRPVDFQTEVFPILQSSCFECHGPERQRAHLRLDGKQVAFKGGKSGPPIVPGDGEGSLLFKRVAGLGEEEQMPPTEKKLSGEQMGQIRAWIDQGARWPEEVGAQISADEKHWAYKPPVRPDIPQSQTEQWVRNPVDSFVLARLEHEGLSPSPEAPKETLIRRLSLDLIGLPPTVEEVDAFLSDPSVDAYEQLVDRLLASPHYGERWARVWLDLARYADTNGYEKDLVRSMWPWRDWVIQAFNRNLPFDQFTIEQLAGDLLPNAAREQLVATGFHRNTMLNDEGGIDPEEFRIVAVKDRVDTTAAVWLGTTLACAQCHEHKFDPFTQADYYRFAAFFNSTKDMGVGENPVIRLPTPEQEGTLARLDGEIRDLDSQLTQSTPDLVAAQLEWERDLVENPPQWIPLEPNEYHSTQGSILTLLPDQSLLAVGPNPDNDVYQVAARLPRSGVTAVRLEALTHETLPLKGPGRAGNAGFVLSQVSAVVASDAPESASKPLRFTEAHADYAQKNFDVRNLILTDPGPGWATDSSSEGQRVDRMAILVVASASETSIGATVTFTLTHKYGRGHNLGRFRLSVTDSKHPLGTFLLPADVREALGVARENRDSTQTAKLAEHFRATTPLLADVRARLAAAREEREKLPVATSMILEDLIEPRKTHVLDRGNFLAPKEEVSPGVPEVISPLPEKAPANRLGLAQWLVDKRNPLTARVMANRIWSVLFGRGLVETPEDFGTQGDPPTHPELLDWLAVEFMDRGWDMKAFHKLIVTSATYRQSSRVSKELLERDPQNRLYAHGPRFRMEAEMVRDNALAVAKLLNPQIGGPSVFPPQPEGIWDNSFTIHDTKNRWTEATDNQRHRRGLYTFIRRTAAYPTLLMFDAPNREVCTIDRKRTNTPLQALATLNDPAFVEAAGGLARRILAEGGDTLQKRLTHAYRVVLARPPEPSEVTAQAALFGRSLAKFAEATEDAQRLIASTRQSSEGLDSAEFAAWIVVSNVLLNLDETITKG